MTNLETALTMLLAIPVAIVFLFGVVIIVWLIKACGR